MAGAASAHQAATATHEETSQQRAGRTRRTSADPQRAQQGATAAAAASPAVLDSLSRLQQLADASPQVAQLQRLQALADGRFAPVAQLAGGPEEEELVQGKFASAELQPQLQQAPRANNTGLPDQLKSGIESLSGLSMDHVRVHYNSSQPAQLNALAYAQGSDIHLAPGQERHLPHEAWHVVQQAQGRVQPTLQLNNGSVPINDDRGLEHEADVMGQKALTQRLAKKPRTLSGPSAGQVAQLTPNDWIASPAIATIMAIPPGWFSTWKKIKAQITLYQALPKANTAARTASLAEMTRLIAVWRADPKHPDESTDKRIHNIHVQLPTLEHLISEEQAEMTAIQLDALGGQSHSLVRHGPDLTDLQLQERLTTGRDRANINAPADVSSRFDDYQKWIRTRTAAVNLADAAKVNTLAALNETMTAFKLAWTSARALPKSSAKGTAIADAWNLVRDINTAAANIPELSPNQLRVNIRRPNNPPMPDPTNPEAVKADEIALENAVQGMPRLRERYTITIDHGVGVGPSFSGTGPHGVATKHPGTIPGPRQRSTTTVFAPPVGPLATAPAAAAWPLITHFPSSDPAGIS